MLEQIKVPLSASAEEQLCRYLRNRILSIRYGLQEIHEQYLPRWRKAYEAVPAEAVREFPFHNASNLVVPIIAIHSDTLLARVMAAVIKTQPMWVARILGEHEESTEDYRAIIEEFLQYVGLEPQELDLFRVYHEWFGEAIRLGTSVVKSPWIKMVEDRVYPAGDGTGEYGFLNEVTYQGPRPEKIPFEDFGIPPASRTIEEADFKYHILRLSKFQLEERAFRRIYDPEKVKEISSRPNRTSPRYSQQLREETIGARTVGGFGFAEWDIYECHFRYRLGTGRSTKYVKLIAWYQESTNTLLRCVFNNYPSEQFIGARLFYRDDMWFGYGFAETLASLQEEVSEIHNGRRDNMTVANSKVWRVDPDSDLHKGYRIYPSAMLPAMKDEIEALDHGNVMAQALSIEEERLTLDLAERRSGVAPPMQGAGAGTNSKQGNYGAIGTLSIMQEGNTRTDLNVTDIRYAHTKLGRLLLTEYAEFGIGDRARLFGESGRKLEEALRRFRRGDIALPVYAATASVNREVEKQNDLMLTGMMQKHHQMITQMLQAASNQMMPPAIRDYMQNAIKSSEMLMKMVMRHFGYDEVDRLVPEAKLEEKPQQQPQPQQGPMLPQGILPQ